MSRTRWHILRQDGALTLARQLPARFDLQAETRLPGGSKTAIAHRVRQDLWRALQHLRGFSPVVRVEDTGEGLRVTAGGRVDGAFGRAAAEQAVAALLASPAHRARWVRHAGRGRRDGERSDA